MDKLSPEQRHRNMKNIRSKNTKIELLLRKSLWVKGYRYRKNCKDIPGTPDIAIPRYKIAIFCDSEFFHGKNWESLKEQLKKGKNSDFWIKKISGNIKRDEEINGRLICMGWTVLRFWGKDIIKNIDSCVATIEEAIRDVYFENCAYE